MSQHLPPGWRRVRLGDVCEVVSGSTPKTGVAEYWDGDIPWLTPDDLSRHRGKTVASGRRFLTAAGYASCSTRLVPAGSVLYSSRAPIGYVAVATEQVCTNQGFKTAIPDKDQLLPDFLYWQLIALTPSIRARASGTTFKEISGRRFAETELVLPPPDEQRRVVSSLEGHLSRLDAGSAYADVSRRIATLRRSALRQGLASVTIQAPRVARLGDVADTALGKMLDAARARGADTPYLRNINVRWGSFDLSSVATVRLTDDERHRFSLSVGDLLVCEGGEPGRCAVWPGGDRTLTFQKALHRVRVRRDVQPAFLALVIEDFVRSSRGRASFTGTTIKHLPQERLRAIDVPVPSIDVQDALVREIAAVEEESSRLELTMRAAGQRSDVLRRTLLTRAFSEAY